MKETNAYKSFFILFFLRAETLMNFGKMKRTDLAKTPLTLKI